MPKFQLQRIPLNPIERETIERLQDVGYDFEPYVPDIVIEDSEGSEE